MAIDFRASQLQTSKIIASGSTGTGATLLVYPITSQDPTTPNQGVLNSNAFGTTHIGSDIFLYVSGGIGQRSTGSIHSITVFGGDLHVSGNLSCDGTGASAPPAGANRQIEFNNNGAFGASSDFWFGPDAGLRLSGSITTFGTGSTVRFWGNQLATIRPDTFFYVSGWASDRASALRSTPNSKISGSTFLGSVTISGTVDPLLGINFEANAANAGIFATWTTALDPATWHSMLWERSDTQIALGDYNVSGVLLMASSSYNTGSGTGTPPFDFHLNINNSVDSIAFLNQGQYVSGVYAGALSVGGFAPFAFGLLGTGHRQVPSEIHSLDQVVGVYTDAQGQPLNLRSGYGTGAGTGSYVLIQAAYPGAAGTSRQPLRDVAWFYGNGNVTIPGTLTVGGSVTSGPATFLSGVINGVRTLTGSYTILQNDYVLAVSSSTGACTLTLPSNPETGRVYIVKDIGGNAVSSNITITGSNGNNVDGAPSYILAVNYASAHVMFFSGAAGWGIL